MSQIPPQPLSPPPGWYERDGQTIYWDGSTWSAPTTAPGLPPAPVAPEVLATAPLTPELTAPAPMDVVGFGSRPSLLPRERWSLTVGLAAMVILNLSFSLAFRLIDLPNVAFVGLRIASIALPMLLVRSLTPKAVVAFLLARIGSGIVGWEAMARLGDHLILGYRFNASITFTDAANWVGQVGIATILLALLDPAVRVSARSVIASARSSRPVPAVVAGLLLVAAGWPVYQVTQGTWHVGITPGYKTVASTSTTTNPVEPNTPQTPADNCKSVVVDFLAQVPDALREGYDNGVDAKSIAVEYGYSSAEYFAATALQSDLIGKVSLNGDPETQLGLVERQVAGYCANATR